MLCPTMHKGVQGTQCNCILHFQHPKQCRTSRETPFHDAAGTVHIVS